MRLRYGINPDRSPAFADSVDGGPLPFRVVHGEPSYINLLDALSAAELVQSADSAVGAAVAASFKHVSPAGVAFADSGVAAAYARARDADPRSSFGDMVAVSRPVDAELAATLSGVVSDGVIAPGFEPGTVDRLRTKKSGAYLLLECRAIPEPEWEVREIGGVRLVQPGAQTPITAASLPSDLPPAARRDLLLGLIAARYTQSNSVVYVREGTTIGIGAGQQSRIDCTRLAGAKADLWWLRQHPAIRNLRFARGVRRQDRVQVRMRLCEGDLGAQERDRIGSMLESEWPDLDDQARADWHRGLRDVALVSDGAFPFTDNIEEAARHGVSHVAEPGGSIRTGEVQEACRTRGIRWISSPTRLFRH